MCPSSVDAHPGQANNADTVPGQDEEGKRLRLWPMGPRANARVSARERGKISFMNDAYRNIVTKRDTRAFLPEPVDDEDVHRVLQAGRMAGSAKNSQLNRLVVVADADKRRRLGECGKFSDWVPSVPVLIAVVIPVDGGRMVDVGRMAQNMLLAAHALGLASCPVTFQDQDCLRPIIDLPSDLEAPLGVGIGRPAPAEPDRETSPRIALEDLVRYESWSA